MTFREAVESIPAIAAHYLVGLQALRPADRDRIRISETRLLRGSVSLDEALAGTRPNQPVWDYGIGASRRPEPAVVVWIESHPASSKHIRPVLAKLNWLRRWLETEAPQLDRLKSRFVWVATGSVAFPANSPHGKIIAQEGLKFRARRVDLDEFL